MRERGVALIGAVAGGLAMMSLSAPASLTLVGGQKEVLLRGPYDVARLLLEEGGKDVGDAVRLEAFDPEILAVEGGPVRGKRDGKTAVIAQTESGFLSIPVTVTGCEKPAPPRFASDVVPTLTRLGCNQGGCHGAQQGKSRRWPWRTKAGNCWSPARRPTACWSIGSAPGCPVRKSPSRPSPR